MVCFFSLDSEDESDSDDGATSTSSGISWIAWYCSLPGLFKVHFSIVNPTF
jgi:hypothetical protein